MKIKEVINEYYKIYDKHYKDGKVYGKSSEDLLKDIAPIIIKLNPKSILDYGCGRSSLIHYFWNDGKRELYKYDPAIREYREKKCSKVDVVICTDVLEHIPEDCINFMLKAIKKHSDKCIFTVSLIPARQKLSDGTNAHITLLPAEKWKELITDVFGTIDIIAEDKNGIFLKTWK